MQLTVSYSAASMSTYGVIQYAKGMTSHSGAALQLPWVDAVLGDFASPKLLLSALKASVASLRSSAL
jgi:hypothetical protein